MALLPRTLSIQTRLIAGMALAASALVVLVGWFWMAREARGLESALQARAERSAQMVARSVAGPLWNLDYATLGHLMDAAMAEPELHTLEIRVRGVAGEPIRRQRDVDLSPQQSLQLLVDIPHQSPPMMRAESLGQARLLFSREPLHKALAQTRLMVVSLLAAMLAAVIISSYWLVTRLVARPVAALGGLAQRVAGGELGATLPVVREDEVGLLTRRLNAMSQQLLSSAEGLRLSEARYRGLFENATEGIFQADARGRLLDLNRALAHMLGYPQPQQALQGRPSLSRLVRVEAAEYRRIARALLRHRVLQQLPLLVGTHDGRELWLELSVHVVAAAEGGPRIEGMVSDITQRRLAEQELTRHRDHLEELVAERTAELNLARLRAESASQSKSRFLATMSHEFRTPLNAILGFSQLLQMDSSLGPAQQAKIKLMRESGEHLLSLVTDLLDMASIEAGKLRLMPAVVDLRALLEVVGDSMRLRAEQKGLLFKQELDPALPLRARVDGQRLRQVLLNLLSNAIKFTDSGWVSLQARVIQRGPASVRLRVEVADSGIGIAPDQLERLFQPFEQVSDLSRRDGGTGLGLSISQQLMQLMDSRIQVSSTPGQGSVFGFELELPLSA